MRTVRGPRRTPRHARVAPIAGGAVLLAGLVMVAGCGSTTDATTGAQSTSPPLRVAASRTKTCPPIGTQDTNGVFLTVRNSLDTTVVVENYEVDCRGWGDSRNPTSLNGTITTETAVTELLFRVFPSRMSDARQWLVVAGTQNAADRVGPFEVQLPDAGSTVFRVRLGPGDPWGTSIANAGTVNGRVVRVTAAAHPKGHLDLTLSTGA